MELVSSENATISASKIAVCLIPLAFESSERTACRMVLDRLDQLPDAEIKQH